MRFRRDERGLSLVETLASLLVFAVITVGITPLLATSLRGSELSRSYTVGKDAALQAMERARGLPYYISYQSQIKKVDVLDLFFPCAVASLALSGCAGEGTRSYDATTKVFTVVCAPVTSGPTCAIPLPDGYTLTYAARFVTPDASGVVTPDPTYKRNPDSTLGEGRLDTPPSQLLELTVTTGWTTNGEPRDFTLIGILGDRKFGDVKMAATGKIAFGVQALTSFVHNSGDTRTSDLKLLAGSAESQMETRLVSTATQRIRGAEITLTRRPTDTDEEALALAAPITGVIGEFTAAPNQTPTIAAAPDPPGATMIHPNIGFPYEDEIASLNETTASNISVTVADELPAASGSFDFSTEAALGYLWVQNQADYTASALLHLDSTRKIFSLRTRNGQLSGTTSVVSTAITGARKVESKASMDLEMLRMLPAEFINEGAEQERHIVLIKDFHAELTCTSVGSASSAATGTWSATLKLWYDKSNNGVATFTDHEFIELDLVDGLIEGSSSDLRTVLAGAPYNFTDGNPLVYDGLTSVTDVYLFSDGLNQGYLTNFQEKPVAVTTGNLVTGAIDGAISITTVPTNLVLAESGLNVTVGSLSCEALDNR